MPRVIAKPDNLNELNGDFSQVSLKRPVFLNSVPKSGTHLIKNVMRMFVPVEQQYHDAFIQIPILQRHVAAFSPQSPKLSWGHLLFSDSSSIATRDTAHVLLVRDPYTWVLARARFFLSENFEANLDHIKNGRAPIEDILNMMIFGIHNRVPTMSEIYMHNAVSWLGTAAHVLRYEELVKHCANPDTVDAEAYFSVLFDRCGMELPEDWRERVKIGADRQHSGTARENLKSTEVRIPDELPATQKRLVDYAAPGLRALLGYN